MKWKIKERLKESEKKKKLKKEKALQHVDFSKTP